jgi:exopolysaccharide biosynthesis protein
VDLDGNVIIAPSSEYDSASRSLKECSGGGVILLMDSQIQGGYVNGSSRDPRTALGYTSENVVWILAVDGRHKGTEGMTYLEMAHIFKALGCVAAVNLDGGGSTQMLVRDPLTDTIEMCNWPSDPHVGFGGRERPRLNSWLIMKSQD